MRDLFPALQKYTYLNAAASSPLATPVAEAAVAQLRDSQSDGDVHFPRWLAFKEDLRARLGRFMNAPAARVAFTPSTSMGFHAVAELFWRRGIREVLTLQDEFPSTTIPFLNRGLTLRVVKPRPDGTYAIADLEGGQAIALSAVQYASGFAIDLKGLTAHCQARKVPLALNVAQALGQVPIDATATQADFICGTSHKWMMGGYGTGIFYAREGWLEEHGLPWSGWFSPPDSLRWQNFPGSTWEGPLARGATMRFEAAALEAGGGHWPALYSFGAALELLEGVGVSNIHAHNLMLQAQLRTGLEKRGFEPNAPAMTGICVFGVQGAPLDAVRALLGEDVVVTPRGVGVRVSTHVFNDASDVAKLLEAIDRVKLKPA